MSLFLSTTVSYPKNVTLSVNCISKSHYYSSEEQEIDCVFYLILTKPLVLLVKVRERSLSVHDPNGCTRFVYVCCYMWVFMFNSACDWPEASLYQFPVKFKYFVWNHVANIMLHHVKMHGILAGYRSSCYYCATPPCLFNRVCIVDGLCPKSFKASLCLLASTVYPAVNYTCWLANQVRHLKSNC